MAHLTCVGHTTDELTRILDSLTESGVRNVLALRGDPAAGPGTRVGADRRRHRLRLGAGRRSSARPATSRSGWPPSRRGTATRSPLDDDVAVLKAKQDAGAEFAVTEMVLRASDYFGLVERARAAGVEFPIIPGIMPILNISSMTQDGRALRAGDAPTRCWPGSSR